MKRIAVIGVPGGWSSEELADAVERRTGFRRLIDMDSLALDLDSGRAIANGEDLGAYDALILKKIGGVYAPDHLDRLEILRYLSERGLPIFSRPERIMRVLDRLSCTVSLRLGGVPMPPTVVTENVDHALDAVDRFGEAVFKPLYSTKARGMTVIAAGADAREEIERFKAAGNPVLYIQKKLRLPGRDLGVVFLGGNYLATYARIADKDSWNTTTRCGGRYQTFHPSSEVLELADKAQSIFGLDFTCVDVVESDDGPQVFEVSAFGGFRGLLEANGIVAADRYVDYVLGFIGSCPPILV